ncbi:MAG TPA: hypothetical protein PLU22_17480, partial [Polyangiaceae bacterium]|nr:hypothetical protein [Polyangiaceae bacterium]
MVDLLEAVTRVVGWARRASVGLLALGVGALPGCDRDVADLGKEAPAAAKVKPENGGVKVEADPWELVPVPPADGPRLAPL